MMHLTLSKLALTAFLLGSSSLGRAETITGTIYCDNYFEFFFNGVLVAKDPVFFTPHNGVKVSFEWDGILDKTYAIMCQDFVTESGYEYIETTSPRIGDGALIAEFSDGTVTSADWKIFVETHGPAQDSQDAAGCAPDNLDPCIVEKNAVDDWMDPGYDDSSWDNATEYLDEETGWGIPPILPHCGPSLNPFTRLPLRIRLIDFRRLFRKVAYNYDDYVPTVDNHWVYEAHKIALVQISRGECINPRHQFRNSAANMVWGESLTLDNRILFRTVVAA
jgi:hypothetical protein